MAEAVAGAEGVAGEGVAPGRGGAAGGRVPLDGVVPPDEGFDCPVPVAAGVGVVIGISTIPGMLQSITHPVTTTRNLYPLGGVHQGLAEYAHASRAI